MLLKARGNCPFSFTDISAGAWGGISACIRNMVNEAICFGLLQLVFGFYHDFAQRATRSNGGTDTLGVEDSAEFFGKAGKVG